MERRARSRTHRGAGHGGYPRPASRARGAGRHHRPAAGPLHRSRVRRLQGVVGPSRGPGAGTRMESPVVPVYWVPGDDPISTKSPRSRGWRNGPSFVRPRPPLRRWTLPPGLPPSRSAKASGGLDASTSLPPPRGNGPRTAAAHYSTAHTVPGLRSAMRECSRRSALPASIHPSRGEGRCGAAVAPGLQRNSPGPACCPGQRRGRGRCRPRLTNRDGASLVFLEDSAEGSPPREGEGFVAREADEPILLPSSRRSRRRIGAPLRKRVAPARGWRYRCPRGLCRRPC